MPPGQGTVLCLDFKSLVYSCKLDNSVIFNTKKLVETQNRPLSLESVSSESALSLMSLAGF